MDSTFCDVPEWQQEDAVLPAGRLTCGIRFLTDFWQEKYFQEYIRCGGSKMKFITGRKGSGKTHFLRLMSEIAAREHYKTAWFSAKQVWMHDFKEIYIEIFHQCDIVGNPHAAAGAGLLSDAHYQIQCPPYAALPGGDHPHGRLQRPVRRD